MSKPLTKCCKNCKWLEVFALAFNGRRIVEAGEIYDCIAPVPPLPDSLKIRGRAQVKGHYGTKCPAFSPLETTP